MSFGQISENVSIDRTIYYCFDLIEQGEVAKFLRKFRQQPHESQQIMHTFRELILGAFLARNGFQVVNEFRIDKKTPDWCIVDHTRQPRCIVELANFHLDRETESDIKCRLQAGCSWYGITKPNTKRLYSSLKDKVEAYANLAARHHLPYVVSVFGDFIAVVEPDELEECLLGEENGLFVQYSGVSGILFYEEVSGDYFFKYYKNPHAVRAIDLPGGWLGRADTTSKDPD